jgi:hypothetical protein
LEKLAAERTKVKPQSITSAGSRESK